VPDLDTLRTRFFYFGGSLRKINVSTDNVALKTEKDKIVEKVQELPSDAVKDLFFAHKTRDIDAEAASARYSSLLWAYYQKMGIFFPIVQEQPRSLWSEQYFKGIITPSLPL